MLSFRKPSPPIMQRYLDGRQQTALTYDDTGATAAHPPAGFVVDQTRVKLGEGEAAFLAARAALQRWEQFRLGWLQVYPSSTPIRTGEVVGVLAQAAGLWWLNPCRIVYVIEESGPGCRFGFAYGTLPGHVQSGEERFLIEWDHAEDSVWYDILAFSRPRHVLARLGYPLVRRFQKRFARDSAAAMQRAVATSAGEPTGGDDRHHSSR